ncbi:hypothetical protein C6Y14_20895 [Streptomyces dioscori]|uniref:Secreted protein n=1 Tax=Streptomyces dioscori TaxID=2109333 RepID=A0A2P8Q4T7_9ACTN|nr:hypothetical protein [Streptomyces dioscori]PSM41255.1 hypothetical protein C6Y14_20895 [Streptomyces dioscori]
MSRRRTLGTKKKIALLVSAAAVAGGGAFALAATSNATPATNSAKSTAQSSVVCGGLATALGNNEKFIEGQRTAPDAQSEARIANREAVIAQIKVQQEASGCTVGESDATVGEGGGAGTGDGTGAGTEAPPAASAPAEQPSQAPSAPAAGGGGGAAAGEQVCNGSTVTLSGEAGAPAASSNQFPAGTKLKVTNLDNNKSTTVEVTSVSGSCVLLNNEAFEQVREPGKFLIRKAVIEKVG